MRNSARIAARGVFGALVLAGLGFGAGQALAAPDTARSAGACLREEAAACNASCREQYGTGYFGQCYKNAWGQVSCGCVKISFP